MKHFEKILLVILALNAIVYLLLGHWSAACGWFCAVLIQLKHIYNIDL